MCRWRSGNGLTGERRTTGAILIGGAVIAAAALATAFTWDRPLAALLGGAGGIGFLGLFAAYALGGAIRYWQGGPPDRLQLFMVWAKFSLLVALIPLLLAWAFAALAGLGAAATLLQALVLTLVAGVLAGMAGTALANFLGAIRGPVRGR